MKLRSIGILALSPVICGFVLLLGMLVTHKVQIHIDFGDWGWWIVYAVISLIAWQIICAIFNPREEEFHWEEEFHRCGVEYRTVPPPKMEMLNSVVEYEEPNKRDKFDAYQVHYKQDHVYDHAYTPSDFIINRRKDGRQILIKRSSWGGSKVKATRVIDVLTKREMYTGSGKGAGDFVLDWLDEA